MTRDYDNRDHEDVHRSNEARIEVLKNINIALARRIRELEAENAELLDRLDGKSLQHEMVNTSPERMRRQT